MNIFRLVSTIIILLVFKILAFPQNVGIGTPSPIDKLHVNGNIRLGVVNPIGFGNGGNQYGDRLFFSGGPAYNVYGSENSDPLWIARYNATNDISELRFCIGDNYGPPYSEIDVFSVGSLLQGLGNNTYYGHLELTSGSQNSIEEPMLSLGSRTAFHDKQYSGGLVITKSPDNSGQYINLIRAGNLAWSLGTIYNTNTFAIGTGQINNSNFSNPQLSIKPTGESGFGVSNPIYRIEAPNINGNLGKGRANAWDTYSDGRFKTNLSLLSGSLERVMSLQPVFYQWIENDRDSDGKIFSSSNVLPGQEAGFIAQDLYKVFPHAVHKPTDESRDYWSIDYSKLTVLLSAAIQEQEKKIQQLEMRIKELENMMTIKN